MHIKTDKDLYFQNISRILYIVTAQRIIRLSYQQRLLVIPVVVVTKKDGGGLYMLFGSNYEHIMLVYPG